MNPLSIANHPARVFAASPWFAAMNVPPTTKPAKTVAAPTAKAMAGSGPSARAEGATRKAAVKTAGNARLRMRGSVATRRCQDYMPLKSAIAAPVGSAMTLKRPMLGMSVGSMSVLAPSSRALRVEPSTSFTAMYSSHAG